MTPAAKRIVAGIVLTIVPILGVYQAKQSTWGKLLGSPRARQLGDPKAPLVMVEFSDFQCPMCARVQPALHGFVETYKGKVRLVYKYYPLTKIHKNAMPAAHAAECAAEQDQFWPYQDRLFQSQSQWAPLADPATSYLAIAQEIRLDLPRFSACFADPAKEKVIRQDAEEARARQITSTPTLFVGEERLVGAVIESDGARVIERELRRQ